jgi:DnaJ-domain-containing protein 1
MPKIPPQAADMAMSLVKRALNSEVVRDAAADIGTKVATQVGGRLADKAERTALDLSARAGAKLTSLLARPPIGAREGGSPFARMAGSSAARELTARHDTSAAGKMAQAPLKSAFSPIAAQAHAAFDKARTPALALPPKKEPLAIEAPPSDEKTAQPSLLQERERRPYSMKGSIDRFDPHDTTPDASSRPGASSASAQPEPASTAHHPKPKPAAKPATKPAAEEPPAPTHEELMAQARQELGIDKTTHWGQAFGLEAEAELMNAVCHDALLTGQLSIEPQRLAGLIQLVEEAARDARNASAARFEARGDIKDSVAAALHEPWEKLQADCQAARDILDTMSAGPAPRREARTKALSALGLHEGASPRDITKAYRDLMLQLHPDRAGEDASKLAARRQEVQDAYDLLK